MTSHSLPAPNHNDNIAEVPTSLGPAIHRLWRRNAIRRAIYLVAVLTVVWFTATSGEPWVQAKTAPNAEEAVAARSTLWQLRGSSIALTEGTLVILSNAQMAGISALVSDGLRPTRMNMSVRDGNFEVQASRPLMVGRWLNLRATFAGKSRGFPSPRLSVGKITLPVSLGRYPFELARAVLLLSGTDLAPLDDMVRAVVVDKNVVTATLKLPRNTGLVDRLAGLAGNAINAQSVVEAYCKLTVQQRAKPEGNFSAQVRRAFAFGNVPPSPARNGAAIIALAMLVADERAGYLAGVEPKQTRGCRIDSPIVTLHGRADLPKHWALSAAIAAAQRTQLARAVGEWKELADSVSSQSSFAAGDPSGFSFVDLAADRAGFQTAMAAMPPQSASAAAKILSKATADQLLPQVLLKGPDGITEAEFKRRFGGLDANRYKAAVERIDRALAAAR